MNDGKFQELKTLLEDIKEKLDSEDEEVRDLFQDVKFLLQKLQTPINNGFSPREKQVIYSLADRQGFVRPETIGDDLGISASNVRVHLNSLKDKDVNLHVRKEEKKKYYRITDEELQRLQEKP